MNIVHVAAEVYPFSKVGGLGDVLGALPHAQWKSGDSIYVITPLYRQVLQNKFSLRQLPFALSIKVGCRKRSCQVFEFSYHEKYKIYFVFNHFLFARGHVYTRTNGSPLKNYTERFLFLQKTALELLPHLPESPDIIHCHDNHVAVLPLYKKLLDGKIKARTLFTIHNIGYQGITSMLEKDLFGLPESYFTESGDLFWQGHINPMKAGIIHSDGVNTVSPTHAKEILESDQISGGMKEIFIRTGKKLYGVLNGVDYSKWSPEVDPFIHTNYSINELERKIENKEALLQELNLSTSLIYKPLIGMVSRLAEQKGIDIFIEAIPEIINMGCGLAILGKGDSNFENTLKRYQKRFEGFMAVRIEYNDPLSHRIIAGSDFFIVPSRYEPCGITQMYSMRYGTIPIVRKTGGLADTVKDWDGEDGTGIVFTNYNSEELLKAIKKAIDIYQNKDLFRKISRNGMKTNFSWEKSADEYKKLYIKLIQ